MALTKKKQLFVMEYVADPKTPASEAAIRAGFSQRRAAITACELMRDPEVKQAIQRGLEGRFKKMDLTQAQVLEEIADIIAAATNAGSGAWQLTARLKAVELQGRFLKMWTDKVELGLSEEIIKRLEAGRKRVALQPTPQLAEAIEVTTGG